MNTMKYLLPFYCDNGYAKAPRCYIYKYITCHLPALRHPNVWGTEQAFITNRLITHLCLFSITACYDEVLYVAACS
jgi:hypothetical protein